MDLRKTFAFLCGQIVFVLFVFIHIPALNVNFFFFVLVPRDFSPPLRRWDVPASDDLSCVFRVGLDIRHTLRATLWGGPVPRPSLPFQAKPEPRGVVNKILAQFPTGRKRFYKMGSPFPAGRKSGLQVSDFPLTDRPLTPAGAA